MNTNSTEDSRLVLCWPQAMECPRCSEVSLYQIASESDKPATLIELECSCCGHYETGAVS